MTPDAPVGEEERILPGAGGAAYDFSRPFSDHLLDLIKRVIPNVETRHACLRHYARAMSFAPLRQREEPRLERSVKFADKSLPLIMGGPVILAAGGCKDGLGIHHFHSLGFGGVTVGTATLKPWAGNPFRPRARLLPLDRAMQNSMGLGNPGIDALAHAVNMGLGRCHRGKLAVGISVAATPDLTRTDDQVRDLLVSFRKAYRAADYVEINVSCPNTGRDRIDWQKGFLETILREIMSIRASLPPRKAVLVKLSPDLSISFLESTLRIIADTGITGLVVFNTFPVDRARYLGLKTPDAGLPPVTADGRRGGVSGAILYQNTLPAVRFIRKELPRAAIFAAGGVDHGARVLDLLEAGADAVQCYTVLAYRWNAVRKMNRELLEALGKRGIPYLSHLPSPSAPSTPTGEIPVIGRT